jgi:hypothetical protein
VSKNNNYDPYPIGLEMFEAMGYTIDGKEGPRQVELEKMEDELADRIDYCTSLELYMRFKQDGTREMRTKDKVYANEYKDDEGYYRWEILVEKS